MTLCIEKKLTLSGKAVLFECELVRFAGDSGTLDYVIDRRYQVGDIELRPGDVTRAFYWTDRPYTLYVWQLRKGRTIYYFNIADRITLRPDEFIWRDLVVDILIDADMNIRILDEEELPRGLPPDLAGYIDSAKKEILLKHKQIIAEIHPQLPALGSAR